MGQVVTQAVEQAGQVGADSGVIEVWPQSQEQGIARHRLHLGGKTVEQGSRLPSGDNDGLVLPCESRCAQ
jgi:hypothetical protein